MVNPVSRSHSDADILTQRGGQHGLVAGEQFWAVTALQLESATRAEEAGEFEVGCLGEAGLERRLPLGDTWGTRFEDGLPVRRFASRRGWTASRRPSGQAASRRIFTAAGRRRGAVGSDVNTHVAEVAI